MTEMTGCWGAPGGLRNCKGETINDRTPSSTNFACWWDNDLLREILDSNQIYKWDWTSNRDNTILYALFCSSNNGTKSTPALCADILGDWREEVIWRTTDNQQLRIYTTTIFSSRRFYTFMHDPIYRLSVARQNVANNQPTQTGFYMGDGMLEQPIPNIITMPVPAPEDPNS